MSENQIKNLISRKLKMGFIGRFQMKCSGSLFFFLHEIFKCPKQSFKEQNKFCKVCSCKNMDVAERGYHKSVLHLSNFCDTIVIAMKSKYARFVVLSTYDANLM